ncbi:heterodisulfide reductase-related iron-sulfur binding cluster, partial [Rothia mucilaginosa]
MRPRNSEHRGKDGQVMRIALFSTCIVDGMYPRVARATVEILERLGHEVVFPP